MGSTDNSTTMQLAQRCDSRYTPRGSVGNDSPCTRDDCRIGYAADAHNKQANAWQPNAGRALLPKHALDIKPKPHASSMPTEIAEFKHPRVLPVEQELPPECHCERKLGMGAPCLDGRIVPALVGECVEPFACLFMLGLPVHPVLETRAGRAGRRRPQSRECGAFVLTLRPRFQLLAHPRLQCGPKSTPVAVVGIPAEADSAPRAQTSSWRRTKALQSHTRTQAVLEAAVWRPATAVASPPHRDHGPTASPRLALLGAQTGHGQIGTCPHARTGRFAGKTNTSPSFSCPAEAA
eukprot:CAMPEP_0170356854 /NCGR_PEP_ID=MMETSP0117_2-20130122/1397_1 /TAXON_ID=400756 /ORGANISM="Durinskia baltica, Strain CSIRO CS-38" /LENGTH=292 /DNA_ID=CAMNT_0010610985 /DNA_START=12 /DNA_END=887 /DNA_ORIENTATION=-